MTSRSASTPRVPLTGRSRSGKDTVGTHDTGAEPDTTMTTDLDPAAVLTFREAAELCGRSDKTLQRDEEAGKLVVVRDGRGQRTVTVQALIDAGRYSPGVTPSAAARDAMQLRDELASERERRFGLEVDLRHERESRERLEREHAQLWELCQRLGGRQAVGVMGRPPTGSVTQLKSGSWQVRVLDKHGSGKDRYEYFGDEPKARQWLAVALSAIKAGDAVAGPEDEPTWIEALAADFFKTNYKAGTDGCLPARHEEVKKQLFTRIVPFFSNQWPTPDDASFAACVAFMEHLAGFRDSSGRWYRDDEARDVLAMRKSTQSDLLSILRRLLQHAVAHRTISFNPADELRVQPPNPHARRRKLKSERKTRHSDRLVPLAVFLQIISGMHPVHMLAALLQRICGLRVSEGDSRCDDAELARALSQLFGYLHPLVDEFTGGSAAVLRQAGDRLNVDHGDKMTDES